LHSYAASCCYPVMQTKGSGVLHVPGFSGGLGGATFFLALISAQSCLMSALTAASSSLPQVRSLRSWLSGR
jgi:hypothetical protein